MGAPFPPHRPNIPGAILHPVSPDHTPPNILTDAELDTSIASLTKKLHAAERKLFTVYLAWGMVSVAIVIGGLVLLWIGPNVFVDRILGVTKRNNTVSMGFWWVAVIGVTVVGGAMGDQVLRGKLRLARNWKHRVDEVSVRLRDAESVKRRRQSTAKS
jgi:uncharacterized membrane protein YidH (DUF202 family)